ncbi:hypothetical protein HDU98_007016 [Podochytrium sp. JEL0797]|nr:hypothetical protein HDU98_007016 [Podochytrium sp. JEL0797]
MQHPPFRYGLVASSAPPPGGNSATTELLARGAYPLANNTRFLSRLRIKTIVSLTPEAPRFHTPPQTPAGIPDDSADAIVPECDPIDPVRRWVKENNIATIHVRVDAPTDDNEIPLSFKQASNILALITNKENMPVYVHCLNGGVVTGLICALLRKLMCWSPKSAIAEYARFLAGEEIDGTGVHEFVDRFVGEVEIPQTIPKWLWGGILPTKKHPTIRLKFASVASTTPNSIKENAFPNATTTTTTAITTTNIISSAYAASYASPKQPHATSIQPSTTTIPSHHPQPINSPTIPPQQQTQQKHARRESASTTTSTNTSTATAPFLPNQPSAFFLHQTSQTQIKTAGTTPRMSVHRYSDGSGPDIGGGGMASTRPGDDGGNVTPVGTASSSARMSLWAGSEAAAAFSAAATVATVLAAESARVSGVSVVSGSKRSVVVPGGGGSGSVDMVGSGGNLVGGYMEGSSLVPPLTPRKSKGNAVGGSGGTAGGEKGAGSGGNAENEISATLNALDLEM